MSIIFFLLMMAAYKNGIEIDDAACIFLGLLYIGDGVWLNRKRE